MSEPRLLLSEWSVAERSHLFCFCFFLFFWMTWFSAFFHRFCLWLFSSLEFFGFLAVEECVGVIIGFSNYRINMLYFYTHTNRY